MIIGFVGFDAVRYKRNFTKTEIKLLKILAGILSSVIEKQTMLGELMESELQFRTLFEQLVDAVFVADADTGNIVNANTQAQKLIGYTLEQLKTMHQTELHPTETKQHSLELFKKNVKSDISIAEHVLLTSDGRHVPVEIKGGGNIRSGKRLLHIGIFRDITKAKEDEAKIRELLAEKDLILKESHHRIKNNMNIVYSLLKLQNNDSNDPETKKALDIAAMRIQSMSILYDKLYRNQYNREINVNKWLPDLAREIVEASKLSADIDLKIEIADNDLMFDVRELSSVGILINELIVNSVKFAFINTEHPSITINVLRIGTHITIIYHDNGVGLPGSEGNFKSSGFGMDLVRVLVKQLNGSVWFENCNGMKVTIKYDRNKTL